MTPVSGLGATCYLNLSPSYNEPMHPALILVLCFLLMATGTRAQHAQTNQQAQPPQRAQPSRRTAPAQPAQPAKPAEPPDTSPAGRCRLLLQGVALQTGDVEAAADGDDGCRFTGVQFGLARFTYQVGTLVEHGLPLDGTLPQDHASHVSVEARDIGFVLHSGQPKVDWLNRQQQVPFDVVLQGSFDPVSGTATLDELSLDGRSAGRTALSGSADQLGGPDWLANGRLVSLGLHMDSRRFITAFLLAPLLPFLPDNDPGAAVEMAKQQAVAGVRALLPQSGASPATVDAIAGFIVDFPHPLHVFDLHVQPRTPVTLNELQRAADSPSALAALVQTLTITASYAGDPR